MHRDLANANLFVAHGLSSALINCKNVILMKEPWSDYRRVDNGNPNVSQLVQAPPTAPSNSHQMLAWQSAWAWFLRMHFSPTSVRCALKVDSHRVGNIAMARPLQNVYRPTSSSTKEECLGHKFIATDRLPPPRSRTEKQRPGHSRHQDVERDASKFPFLGVKKKTPRVAPKIVEFTQFVARSEIRSAG